VDARGKILQIADDCYKIIEEQMDPALEKDGKSWKEFTSPSTGRTTTVHPRMRLYQHTARSRRARQLTRVAKHPAMWNFPRAQSSATIVIDPEFPKK
jgi:hypothetical protein